MGPPDRELRHSMVEAGGAALHVVEAGDPNAAPFVFLHGWPQSWRAWLPVMEHAADSVHAIAIDLPGIGDSTGAATDGSKLALARVVRSLVEALGLRDVTLVGHDIGGMIAYPYMRTHDDLARAVIMDIVVPGVDPWDEVLRNRHIWHFAMHAVPGLPERLVRGREADYFAHFYGTLPADAGAVGADARAAYAAAYASVPALTAGFDWYRAFEQDAVDNRRLAEAPPVSTPLLYVRGEHETWTGGLDAYAAGFAAAGVTSLQHALVPGAGHFTIEGAPEATWRIIADFAGVAGGRRP